MHIIICILILFLFSPLYFFFFNDPPTTEIYTLSLHDALPFSERPLKDIRDEYNYPKKKGIKDECSRLLEASSNLEHSSLIPLDRKSGSAGMPRPISYAVFCLKKKKERMISVMFVLRFMLGCVGLCSI